MRELRPEGAIYEIEKVAGQGHSATVYRAIKKDSRGHCRQVVALKILKSRTAVSWLKQEFEALARVDSPHCVRVLGWENLESGPALVLEWIDGLTLFDLARRHVLSAASTLEIIAQAQLGLKDLHACGLHHGDLSPSNILIDRQGRVRLVDFAVRAFDGDSLVGTPAYMAPELWAKSPPSGEADLFSLGLLQLDLATQFFEMPEAASAARERAHDVALSPANPLLARDPKSRRWLDVTPDKNAQAELADSVKHAIDLAPVCPQTQGLAFPTTTVRREIADERKKLRFSFAYQARSGLSSRSAVCAFLVLLTSTVAVRAQAPLIAPVSQPAILNVRSQKWVEIGVNGRALGFAPIQNVRLQPGSHRLSWRTASRHGDLRLEVKSGEQVWLTETELLGKH